MFDGIGIWNNHPIALAVGPPVGPALHQVAIRALRRGFPAGGAAPRPGYVQRPMVGRGPPTTERGGQGGDKPEGDMDAAV